MVDIIVDKIIDSLKTEIGLNSTIYTDNKVEFISNKSLDEKFPSPFISVLEGESRPTDYNISDRIAHAYETYTINIQTLVRAADEIEAKTLRRIITQRIKHAILRKGGAFFTSLLTAIDEGTGYKETIKNYRVDSIDYDNGVIEGAFLYISVVAISVDTDIEYIN